MDGWSLALNYLLFGFNSGIASSNSVLNFFSLMGPLRSISLFDRLCANNYLHFPPRSLIYSSLLWWPTVLVCLMLSWFQHWKFRVLSTWQTRMVGYHLSVCVQTIPILKRTYLSLPCDPLCPVLLFSLKCCHLKCLLLLSLTPQLNLFPRLLPSTEMALTESDEHFSVLILLYFCVMIGHSWSLYSSQTLTLSSLLSHSLFPPVFTPIQSFSAFHWIQFLCLPITFVSVFSRIFCVLQKFLTPLSNLIYLRNFNPCLCA